MSKLYTVVEKSLVLKLLQTHEVPKIINNIGYSNSCNETIFEIASDSFLSLNSILPCIYVEDDEFAEALTERFPINWQTHMYLLVDVDESRVFNLKHSVLLDLSTLPEPIDTEEMERYHSLLLNDVNSDFKLGIGKDAASINFLTDLEVGDICGYLILDEDFDPHEDTDVKMSCDMKTLQEAVRSSVFGG